MSESGPHNPNQNPTLHRPVLFDQDADASQHEEQQQSPEVPSGVLHEAAIAYHGAKAAIAEWRERRADNKEKDLNRKEKLYEHLGSVASGQAAAVTDAEGKRPRPKTWSERFMDRRVEERDYKKAVKQVRRDRTVKVFGGEKSDTVEFDPRMDTIIRKGVAKSVYREGGLNAHELRLANMRIEGSVNAFENSEQRRTRRAMERSDKQLKRAARQPIASRWRSDRLEDIRNNKARHQARANKHRERQEELRASREAR